MLINSVREVKEQLRAAIDSLGVAAEMAGFLDVSVGISVGKGIDDYKLAVRFRSPKPILENQETILTMVETLTGVSRLEMDVQYTGPVRAIEPPQTVDVAPGRLRIGSSISYFSTRAGTLGFFATPIGGGKPGFVSANHVIGFFDDAKAGDPIVHPGGSNANPKVGRFVKCVKLRGGGEKFVDAAFAELTTSDFDPEELPNNKKFQGKIAVSQEVTRVAKFAEVTGETHGKVRSFDFDKFKVLSYAPGLNIVRFEDQIEIESLQNNKRFSAPGDSGSLVYDQSSRAVGLLFAETVQGGTFNNGLSYVNPIGRVLHDLQVELLP
jgi:hypothetical protein